MTRNTVGILLVVVLAVVAVGVSVREDREPAPEALVEAVMESTTRPAVAEGIPAPASVRRRRERDEPEPTEILPAPETGIGLGWGWNTFHAEAIPTTCVEFLPDSVDKGQTATLDFTEVNDTYELMSALDMSAEASVKSMGYEVKGEMKFASKTKVNGSELTYVIEAEVLNSPTIAAPAPPEEAEESQHGSVRLTREAESIARRDVELFKDVCGNGYISATMGGAKLSVVVSVKTRTKSERTTMSSEIEGKGWGAKVNAAMSGSSQSGSSSFNREVHFFQSGGKPETIPVEVTDIIKQVEGLAKDADKAQKIFRIAITPYEVLENWPREDEITGSDQEFEQLSALWGSYKSMYDEVDAALAAPKHYVLPSYVCFAQVPPDPKAEQTQASAEESSAKCATSFVSAQGQEEVLRLEAFQDELIATLDRLEIAARRCIESEEDCETDTRKYRSPYAMQVRMPVETCELIESLSAEEISDMKAARIAAWNADHPENPIKNDNFDQMNAKVRTEADGDTPLFSEFQVEPTCDAGRVRDGGDLVTARSTYGDLMVHDIAKSRCTISSLTPGCLSNAAIRSWTERAGRSSIILRRAEHVTAVKAALETDPKETDARCSGLAGSGGLVSSDPGTTLLTSLWYPPACEARVVAAVAALSAPQQ